MEEKSGQEQLLASVPDEKAFYVSDGTRISNLKELLAALRKIDESTFKHHVNKEKNDFKNWALFVLNDKKLAKDISRVKNQERTIEIVKRRIKTIQRAIQRKRKK